MPVFIAAIWGAFVRMIPHIVGQILISLGIASITYVGMDMTINHFKADALAGLSMLPPEAIALIGYLKVGQCINMVFSSMLARMAYNGMKNGAMKKLGRK